MPDDTLKTRPQDASKINTQSAAGLARIHIQNFRAFQDIEIGPFRRINLITGFNNAGKTGLLEAIFLVLQREQQNGQDQRTQPAGLPNLFRVFSQQADQKENFWQGDCIKLRAA